MTSRSNSKAASAEAVTYRLASAEFVSAPGLIRWAINGAKFEKDRAQMIDVVAQTWSVPPDAAEALLTEQVPFSIEGETVVFAYGGSI